MMRWEYLIAGIVSCLLALLLDRVVQTSLVRQRRFWIFLGLILCCQLVFDGYLTARPVTFYDPCCHLGPRLPILEMPIEELPFGIMLASFTIILWEWSGRLISRKQERDNGINPT